MRYLTHFLLFFLVSNLSTAQVYEPTHSNNAAKSPYEDVKQHFLNDQFAYVVDYYESITGGPFYSSVEIYKMAHESSLKLAANNPEDSALYLDLAEQAYNEAIKWYGTMLVEEIWDSITIELNKKFEVFKDADQQPEFPGGMTAFYRHTAQHLRYPEEARKNGIKGRVFVQFIVNKDGSVDAVNILKGIGGGCDESVVIAIATAPDFIPGKYEGEPVYVLMVMPFSFE